METEKGTYPGRSEAAPTAQVTGEASTAPPPAAPPGKIVAGRSERARAYVRASAYVKDAVDKTREKMAGYRDGGIEQVSQDIVEYARSQPKTALLIATGVGLMIGLLLTLGRK